MAAKKKVDRRPLLWPFLAFLICVFLWAANLTFDAGDWPSSHQYPHAEATANACGRAGAFVAYHMRRTIGDGVYPLILFATCAAVLWLFQGHIVNLLQRVFGLLLVVVCTSASVHLISEPGANALEFGEGGLVGAAAGNFLSETFAGVGAVLVLGYCFLVGLLFTAEGWMLRVGGALGQFARSSGEMIASARDHFPRALPSPAMVTGAVIREVKSRVEPVRRKPRSVEVDQHEPAIKADPEPEVDDPDVPRFRFHGEHDGKTRKGKARGANQPSLFEEEEGAVEEPKPSRRGGKSGRKQSAVAKSARSKTTPVEPPRVSRPEPEPPAEAYPRMLDAWEFPPLSMLGDPVYTFGAAQESVLRAKAKTLERTLQEFRLDARVVEIDTGPVITMFELSIGAGIKVSQISALANDVARALKAPSVRIIAPIPGKNTVGVEVPNSDKETVRLKSLIVAGEERSKKMAIPLFLGKDASGSPLVADLAGMPHMLIAGTTGSGKSVCMNTIIMSVLMCRRPDMVKLILIDPKMVEMSQFKDVPHLMAPIVTDMNRAEQILEWAVTKMDERYALIAEARVRNVGAFNKLSEEELYRRLEPSTEQEKAAIPKRLPYIVIMIDELADLMMTSAKEVEHHLARLAQKSRAVGIHIIVATQRPEAKVVTGLIKSNLPCRLAFRVASRMDSRIVLDQNGAEVLLGQGDMLFLPPGSHKLMRAQGTYVEDDELMRVIDFLGDHAKAEFHPELMKMNAKGADSLKDRDPLFDDAVQVVLETKRGSVSLLQRRLTIGYSRASRLIEQMAAAGIVGEYKGSQAREVMVTPEEWEQLRAAADTAPGVQAQMFDLAHTPDEVAVDEEEEEDSYEEDESADEDGEEEEEMEEEEEEEDEEEYEDDEEEEEEDEYEEEAHSA